MPGFFGSARSRYANALNRHKALYKLGSEIRLKPGGNVTRPVAYNVNILRRNAKAKNAARAQQKEATRALWSARRRRVMDLLGRAKNGAAAVTRKVGSGLATGGLAVVGAAAAAAMAAGQAAKYVGGKAYGAAGRVAAAAAAGARAAAAKVRSLSVGRRLREGGAAAAGKLKAAARVMGEKTRAAVSATRKALGKAGAAISKGASNAGAFLGRGLGAARNYVSRKASNARKGLSNMYTRMRFGGHEARLDAERAAAQKAVNAAEEALKRNSDAKAKAAGRTLGEIAAKLKKADVAAANGSNGKAATAIGAAATAAKTAVKKGWFSKLGNAARGFTRNIGARLGKLRNMFKGTKKNNAKNVAKSPLFKGSIVTNPGPYISATKKSPARFIPLGQNAYGLPVKAAEGRSARKLMNVLAGRSEGVKPLMFGLPAPMSRSAAARRFA